MDGGFRRTLSNDHRVSVWQNNPDDHREWRDYTGTLAISTRGGNDTLHPSELRKRVSTRSFEVWSSAPEEAHAHNRGRQHQVSQARTVDGRQHAAHRDLSPDSRRILDY